jgi:thymidylate kinase
MEAEGLAFQQRVAGGFLALAARGPDPWLVVDATDPVEMVAAMVWEAVEVLAGQGGPP